MTGAGTLSWLEEQIEEISQIYDKYARKAGEMNTTILAEAGRENINYLNTRLDDIIDALEDHSSQTALELKERAYNLNREILNT